MNEKQLSMIRQTIVNAKQNCPFYSQKLEGVDVTSCFSESIFTQIPFTEKKEICSVPFQDIFSVDERKIVRIHSTSGTTGRPLAIPYTRKDINDWTRIGARCLAFAGITSGDRVQISTGYGFWTAGIGFQSAAEKLSALAIPIGSESSEKQLQTMVNYKSTALICTSSFALLLSEEVIRQKLQSQIRLKKGIIGSEYWGNKTKETIKKGMNIDLYDIYGLTEAYGPGIAISCSKSEQLHYWDDFFYFEIIDPMTTRPVQDGEYGELVITTLKKEGFPLIRYRTHDITRIISQKCPCGSHYPRIGRIIGRTDDMVKAKGCNMYPSQIEQILSKISETTGEYLLTIRKDNRIRDVVDLRVEVKENCRNDIAQIISRGIKNALGLNVNIILLKEGILPRSNKKTKRIVDLREERE